ncbi:MAG: putative electron transfer flavoprotein FixA [Propioniciclava sp.]
MKVIACFKVVHDERDLVTGADGTVSLDRAGLRVGDYDLNAIEAGVQLKTAEGELVGLTVGGPEVTDSKVRKSVLARGLDALTVVHDPSLADADADATAVVVAAAVKSVGDCDVVICGEGSADRYAQQVGAQVAARLELPYVNAVSRLELSDAGLTLERTLENEVETLAVSLPVVISVAADSNSPRIPTMKDILGAGKKSTTELSLDDVGVELPAATVTVGPEKVPAMGDREQKVFETGQTAEFFGALRQLIGKDAK